MGICKLCEYNGIEAAVKLVDTSKSAENRESLVREIVNYQFLKDLQGIVIPKFYCYGDFLGILEFFCMELCSTSECWEEDKKIAIVALKRLHEKGIKHGDVRKSNFVFKGQGIDRVALIIDLESLQFDAAESELDLELSLFEEIS